VSSYDRVQEEAQGEAESEAEKESEAKFALIGSGVLHG
jgi:hypothetical protein